MSETDPRASEAYWRGRKYALRQIHFHGEHSAIIQHLCQAAEKGLNMGPSPFDTAILDVISERTNNSGNT